MSFDGCDDCNQPSTTPYKPDPQLYAQGDICAIFESPSVPVYLILTGAPPRSRSTSRMPQSTGSLLHKLKEAVTGRTSSQSNRSTGSSDANPRPALILQNVILPCEEGEMTVTVCLLATFNSTVAREDLPLVLRHFCIPVSPHPLATGDEWHIHTMPQWEKSDTWIIAIPFESKMKHIPERWKDRRREAKPDGSFKLSVQATADLLMECEKRAQEWDRQCQEEGHTLAGDALKDYDEHARKAAALKAAKSKRSGGSFGSGRSSGRSSGQATPNSRPWSPTHSRSGSGLHMTGGSPSPVGIRSASRQSPSASKGSFFATKGETTTNALVAETQREATNPLESGAAGATTSLQAATSSSIPHGLQVAEHALPQGVSTESFEGDVQEVLTQTVRPLSPSLVGPSTSSQRSSMAESARPKRIPAYKKIVVKLPATFKKLTGSNSSIGGASNGSGRTKEK